MNAKIIFLAGPTLNDRLVLKGNNTRIRAGESFSDYDWLLFDFTLADGKKHPCRVGIEGFRQHEIANYWISSRTDEEDNLVLIEQPKAMGHGTELAPEEIVIGVNYIDDTTFRYIEGPPGCGLHKIVGLKQDAADEDLRPRQAR